MGKPKSFKDTIKESDRPKDRVLPTIQHIRLSESQILKRKQDLAQMNYFVNNLKCKVCKSQLDGHISHVFADLYCRSDPDHYIVNYSGLNKPTKEIARLIHEDTASQYEISSVAQKDGYFISVSKIDLTMNVMLRQKFKERLFSYVGASHFAFEDIKIDDLLQDMQIYQIME